MQTVLPDTASTSPNEQQASGLSKQSSLQRKGRTPVLQPPLALGSHTSRGLATLHSLPSSHNLDRQPSFAFESTSLSGRNCTHVAQLGHSSQVQQPDVTVMDQMHSVTSKESEHASSTLGRYKPDAEHNSKGCAMISYEQCSVNCTWHGDGCTCSNNRLRSIDVLFTNRCFSCCCVLVSSVKSMSMLLLGYSLVFFFRFTVGLASIALLCPNMHRVGSGHGSIRQHASQPHTCVHLVQL